MIALVTFDIKEHCQSDKVDVHMIILYSSFYKFGFERCLMPLDWHNRTSLASHRQLWLLIEHQVPSWGFEQTEQPSKVNCKHTLIHNTKWHRHFTIITFPSLHVCLPGEKLSTLWSFGHDVWKPMQCPKTYGTDTITRSILRDDLLRLSLQNYVFSKISQNHHKAWLYHELLNL